MNELFDLRGASPPTAAESLRRKVNRLHSKAYAGMVSLPGLGSTDDNFARSAADFDTSHASQAPVIMFVTAHHSSKPAPIPSESVMVEIASSRQTLRHYRTMLMHGDAFKAGSRWQEAIRESLRGVRESFERLAPFSNEQADEPEAPWRVVLDELESATHFQVQDELAHALLSTSHYREEDDWNDDKNRRRCQLVDKEIEGTLSCAEAVELERLQSQMLAYRRKLAPLPLDEARELHQALLKKASMQADRE